MPTPHAPWLVRVMKRFSYSQKFIIISILFAISLVVSGFFMIEDQNATINLAQRELKGMTYVQAVQKLLQNVAEHSWKSYSYLNGDTGLKEDVDNLSRQITSDFKTLIAIDQTMQTELATTSKDFKEREEENLTPDQLQREWNRLSERLSTITPDQSDAMHENLLVKLRSLILYIGETANLILDPTLEGSYHIQNLLWNLPKATVNISKIMIIEEALAKKQKIEPKEKEQLLILLTLLRLNIKDTKTASEKAIATSNSVSKKNHINEEQIKTVVDKYNTELTNWLKNIEDTILLTHTPTFNTKASYVLANDAIDDNTALWDDTAERFTDMLEARISDYKKQQLFSVAASVFCTIVGVSLGLYMMRNISVPLQRLLEATRQLEQGNIAARVHITEVNEMGQVSVAFNRMADSFQELLERLQSNGNQLTASSQEIADASKQQEVSILQQESATKQIASTAKSISETAREFAKTMNAVSTNSEQTSSLAASGKAGLHLMEIAMQQMVDASQHIAAKLAILNEKAGNITNVVTTITKVADQTNLLSLNAAIEAEKAGEHGRTFTVIANEIRRLADQTGNATLDIEKMVNEMISAVSAGVTSVDKFTEEIRKGVHETSAVGEQLNKIIEQVQQQTKSFEIVNRGMQAQSLSAEQINESITQLGETAHQVSKSIRQFQKAIEELNGVAKEIQISVAKIKH